MARRDTMDIKNIKAFWVTKDSIAPYSIVEHAKHLWNFLLWTDGGDGDPLLLAGAGGYFDTDDMDWRSHRGLRDRYVKLGRMMPKGKPIAAGTGTVLAVTGWGSFGFDMKTPEELKPIILEVLGCEDGTRFARIENKKD